MCSPGWRSRRPLRARRQRSTRKSPRQITLLRERLWEHLMLNSPGSRNGLARPYSVPSRELRIALRDNSSPTHENLARAPRLDLAVTPGDYANDDASRSSENSTLVAAVYVFHRRFCVIRLLRRFAERNRDFFRRVMSYRSKYPAAGGDFSVRATQVHFSRLTRSESRDDGTRT